MVRVGILFIINLGMINIISDLVYYPGLFEGISSSSDSVSLLVS